MAAHLWWMWILLHSLPSLALTEFQYLQVVKEFADSYLSPHNTEIARHINSTLFAEDVKGSVDLSTNFDTRELATEYLFGLFVSIADHRDEPAPFGVPTSYNITHALVQRNTVAAGLKFNFYYPTLDENYPIEMEAFMNVNEQRQVTDYDIIFRRWAWAIDTVVPRLVPQMADKLGIVSNNETYILQQYLSDIVCSASLTSCNGTNEHYESREACLDFLSTKPIGQFYRMGEDNLVCRYLHTGMLHLRPSVHCPHVGMSGGEFCVPRNYSQVVLDSHFSQGFIAPKHVTPENRKAIQDIFVTNQTPLDPLLEIALDPFDQRSWDPSGFATFTFVFFLVLHLSSRLCFVLLAKASTNFQLLTHEFQINVIMYSMNIFYTAVALALQLASVPLMFGTNRLWMVQCLRCSGAMICSLYCFELVFRHDMRMPLIVHHFLTIFAISFTVSVFEYTQSMTYASSAIIWLLQATAEQSVFVGLMGYRLKWNRIILARTLKYSAIQTLVVKVSSALALLVYWGFNQRYSYRAIDTMWSVIVWVIGSSLLATQFWGSYVVYIIGCRVADGDVSFTPTRPHLSPIQTLTSPTPWVVRNPFDTIGSPRTYKVVDGEVYRPLLADQDPRSHTPRPTPSDAEMRRDSA